MVRKLCLTGHFDINNVYPNGITRCRLVQDDGKDWKHKVVKPVDRDGNKQALPWRWCAPETLTRAELSHKSDVWQFGTTLWQLLGLDNGLPFRNIAGNYKQLRKRWKAQDPKEAVPLNWGKRSDTSREDAPTPTPAPPTFTRTSSRINYLRRSRWSLPARFP